MNLNDYSDYKTVLSRAKQYYGENVKLLQSTRKTKKYMIFDRYNNKFVHFGQMGYLDYTKYVQLYNLETANKHRYRYLILLQIYIMGYYSLRKKHKLTSSGVPLDSIII